MRTIDTITEMLLGHVAIPAEDLQVVGIAHLNDGPPPIATIESLAVLFPVSLVIYRKEWETIFGTARTLPTIVRQHLDAQRRVAGIRLRVPSFTILRFSYPSQGAIVTSLTLCLSAARLATPAQSTLVALLEGSRKLSAPLAVELLMFRHTAVEMGAVGWLCREMVTKEWAGRVESHDYAKIMKAA